MLTIVFEAHSTTTDNNAKLASGFNDVALSPLGLRQSKELGERYSNETFDAIFCSDLQRSYITAEIAFDNKYPIIHDSRLRECDYGDMTLRPKEIVDAQKPQYIAVPFPNGESYEQSTERIRCFLVDLLRNYQGKRVMIIGHRATQYGLEHLIKKIPLHQTVIAPWKWQPGWEYLLKVMS
ncbi:MAG: histidine phosphatase family protein [Candidatus Saccharibacteria bacterium]